MEARGHGTAGQPLTNALSPPPQSCARIGERAAMRGRSGIECSPWCHQSPKPACLTATVRITNDGRPKGWPLLTDGSRVFFNSGPGGGEAGQVSVEGGESIALPLPVRNAQLVDVSPDRKEWLLCKGLLTNRLVSFG